MNVKALLIPRLLFATAAVAAWLLAPVRAIGQDQEVKESFTGFAINLNSGPRTATIDFTITRWSTDEERESLLAILVEEKDPNRANDKLLKALQKLPKVGFIRTSTSLGWDLHYAREGELPDGGRRIVLATDRPIGFAEARNNPRSMDYPFTILEMQLNKENKGQGKILAGTKIYIDKSKNLVLENYGQQPVRFNEIHKTK
jgi:hypothetical protein